MVTAINDEMFSGEAITDPYSYYGRIRDEDPVHWNELYELGVITRHDDLVWMTRHHELFSSEFWARDKRPPYPAIDESDSNADPEDAVMEAAQDCPVSAITVIDDETWETFSP